MTEPSMLKAIFSPTTFDISFLHLIQVYLPAPPPTFFYQDWRAPWDEALWFCCLTVYLLPLPRSELGCQVVKPSPSSSTCGFNSHAQHQRWSSFHKPVLPPTKAYPSTFGMLVSMLPANPSYLNRSIVPCTLHPLPLLLF